ncbi:RNA helicase [Cryptotrichosporon argae]
MICPLVRRAAGVVPRRGLRPRSLALSTCPVLSRRQQEPFPAPSPRTTHQSLTLLSKSTSSSPALPSNVSLERALADRIAEWAGSTRAPERLAAYGVDGALARPLLREWADATAARVADGGVAAAGFDVAALALAHAANDPAAFESAVQRHFMAFVAGRTSTPASLAGHLSRLLRATDLSRAPFRGDALGARAVPRHFHLHVGPTNSGKTYAALRALGRAPTGVYAGPLRLLAHEVWERVNLGTVGGLEGAGRACNLLTGEERRVVDPDAGLLSCTVEMVPPTGPAGPWDVVVIDEMQMLADEQRGGAWTSAVMNVAAREVHLCGDDTAVDLLRALVESYGDELTVHRYERLTPLTVADKSLEGDWTAVRPGDCVVTFSRSNIFAVKKLIEQKAGRKCAVVYGALPPETRAEQARDFNDDAGRAEVLVASDAVGMGLNLKINRMIFESLHKFDGKNEVPLALTQVKQIAGRAGRFGQAHASASSSPSSSSGGQVTTLYAADLPRLRELLPLPLPAASRAVLEAPPGALADLAALLPPTTTFAALLEHLAALARLPARTALASHAHKIPLARLVETSRAQLALDEVALFTHAPVNHRDERVAAVFSAVVAAYAGAGLVELEAVLAPTRLLKTLDVAETTLAALPPLPPHLGIGRPYLAPPVLIASIPALESLHKALVLYIWLSFRLDVAFPDRALALKHKERAERVLEACLERLPGLRQKKSHERTKEMDKEVALHRRMYTDKHGKVKPPIEWVRKEQARRGGRLGAASFVVGE